MSIELNDISSGYSTGLINDNFQAVEQYINDNLLNRDGTTPGQANQMEVALDMNGNAILNAVTDPTQAGSLITVGGADARYVNSTGDTMSGNLSMGGNLLRGLGTPVAGSDAARLEDVQAAIAGGSANLISFTPYDYVTSDTVQGAIQQVADAVQAGSEAFASVQAAKDEVSLSVGDIFSTVGYRTAGDGGWNQYEVVAAGTGASDGGAYIDLTASGHQARALFPAGMHIKQWGAYSNGATDDAVAVQSALRYVATNGGTLHVSENTVLNSLVTVNSSAARFNVLGGSFIVTNSTGGIKWTLSDIAHRFVLTSHFMAGIQGSGYPFEVVYPLPDPVSWRTHSLILDRVECRPLVYNDGNYRWSKGIRLVNCWHASLYKVYVIGGENGNLSCEYGIKTEQYSVNVDYVACYTSNVDKGFWAGGESEGPRYYSSNSVVAKRGFVLDGNSANPQAVIQGCHTNVTERAVYMNEWNGVTIDNCEFYRLANATGYKDVEAVGGQDLKVMSTRAALGNASENWFVYLNNHRNALIKDNQLAGRWHHVECVGNTAYTSASNNRQEAAVNTEAEELLDNSTGVQNKLKHWRMEDWNSVTVTANGATNNIPSGSDTVVEFAAVRFNDQVGFSSGTPTRITAPDWSHSVRISGSVDFPTNGTGNRVVKIRKNGSAIIAKASVPALGGSNTTVNVPATRVFASAGDYFELLAYQDSGGSLNVSQTTTIFEMEPVSSGG